MWISKKKFNLRMAEEFMDGFVEGYEACEMNQECECNEVCNKSKQKKTKKSLSSKKAN